MDNIIVIFVVSMITEAVWESLKMTWQNGKVNIDRIGALIIGLVVAIGTRVDILDLVGVSVDIPYLGMILTGILMSRGSNFIHDLLVKVSNPKVTVKEISNEISDELKLNDKKEEERKTEL